MSMERSATGSCSAQIYKQKSTALHRTVDFFGPISDQKRSVRESLKYCGSPVFGLVPSHCPPDSGIQFFDSLPITRKNPLQKQEVFLGDPYGNRTHVTAVKGRCLNRLTNGPGSGNLIRTDDIPGMNRVLYQLSYAAIFCFAPDFRNSFVIISTKSQFVKHFLRFFSRIFWQYFFGVKTMKRTVFLRIFLTGGDDRCCWRIPERSFCIWC